MATMTRRTITTTRHEYLIPIPAAGAEVDKAVAVALQHLEAAGKNPGMDDAVNFDADDENIIVYWEEEAEIQ